MFRVTVFSVQQYRRVNGAFEKGDLRLFRSETTARNAARVARHHVAGVVVYAQKGNPEFDCWSDPEPIEAFGDVPREEPAWAA